MPRLEWIRTGSSPFNVFLDNYNYRLSDTIIFIWKNATAGRHGAPLFYTVASNTAQLLVQFNRYSGRKCLNFAHGGVWAGDSNYSYESPDDLDNYYKVVITGNIMQIYKGTTLDSINDLLVTSTELGADTDTDTTPLYLLPSRDSSSDVYFYSMAVIRGNVQLIHDYRPYSGGVIDVITDTVYYTSSTTYENGPEWIPPAPPTGEFPVYIQRNNSEAIYLDKDLTDILTTNAWLKESTSIINPTFVLEASLADLIRANYVTVPTFGRSYFIQDIISLTTDLVELNCHVDVLSSFKDDIRANKGITHRQEENWNLYLNDGVLQVYQNPIVTTQKFPNGFTENNFVLVLAGSRNAGVFVGEGGAVQVEPTVTFTDGGGAGNTTSKTTSGLVQWGYRHYNDGAAYWFGTFGQTADADLLQERRSVYSSYYPDPGNPPFVDQFGKRVFDCVGLIKGYRWYKFPSIHYEASQDVDVKGLWNQCIKNRGYLQSGEWNPIPYVGAVLFTENLDHCGILVERNLVIEARGHLYGVVASRLEDRYFTRWGVPDWMQIDTPRLTE